MTDDSKPACHFCGAAACSFFGDGTTEWERWFDEKENQRVTTYANEYDKDLEIETIYQMFKARMMAEMSIGERQERPEEKRRQEKV